MILIFNLQLILKIKLFYFEKEIDYDSLNASDDLKDLLKNLLAKKPEDRFDIT
jgi:hypothetical protein